MANCKKDSMKFQEYLDKLMDAKKKGLLYYDIEMEKHLEECEVCRLKFKDEQQLFTGLDSLYTYEPPADFTVQLMKRVANSNQASARQPLPLWGVLALVMSALFSTTFLVGGGLWLWGNETVLAYLFALTSPILDNAWLAMEALMNFCSSLYSVLSGIGQFIWLIVGFFPITSLVIVLMSIFIFWIMIKLIANFQNENYA